MRFFKRLLAVVGGFFVIVVLLGVMFGSDERATAAATPTRSAPAQPDVSVSAADIADAYERNTVAADEQFKGRRLLVSGRVADINTDLFGDAVVVLDASKFLNPQAVLLKSEKGAAARLQRGDAVALLCVGNGDVAKMPMMKDCIFR